MSPPVRFPLASPQIAQIVSVFFDDGGPRVILNWDQSVTPFGAGTEDVVQFKLAGKDYVSTDAGWIVHTPTQISVEVNTAPFGPPEGTAEFFNDPTNLVTTVGGLPAAEFAGFPVSDL